MILSTEQRRAVERLHQDVCVVAGPGSGKTRVLTERFAWLVATQGVDPSRILAITFTEKAATEIKERVIKAFENLPHLREGIERAWVSTIHGFCARLLREHVIEAGLPPDFAVLEQPSAGRLAREAAEETIDAAYRARPQDIRTLLQSLDLSTQDDAPQPDLAAGLLEVYEAIRVSGQPDLTIPSASGLAPALDEARVLAEIILRESVAWNTENQRNAHAGLREWARQFLSTSAGEPPELTINLAHLVKNSRSREAATELKNVVLKRARAEWIASKNAPLLDLMRSLILEIGANYREKKRSQSALDFADLEEETIRLLERDERIRTETIRRFDEILLDELQDTNRLQWRLINLIRGNLFAVGDVNQSIYGFRHADPDVFHEYRRTLLDAGASIDELHDNHRSYSEVLAAVSRMLDGQGGIECRELVATRGPGPAVERMFAQGEHAEAVEAALVAARIKALIDTNQYEFRDVAVLVRALSAVEPFEAAFDRFGIPFLVSGGRTFLEAREMKDLVALLAALVNPLDQIAVTGVLRSPLAGFSDEELYRLGEEGRLEAFHRLFGHHRKSSGFRSPDLILSSAIDECGYAAALSERARSNVEKFLSWLRRQHSTQPRPLAEMLDDTEALRAAQSEAEAPPPDAANVVRIMSIHAAKGLEFPVVFVSALHRRPDARKPVIAHGAGSTLGAKWRHPDTGKGLSDAVHLRYLEDLKRKEQEEENRLLYVAMTRAADRLILSHAETRQKSPWVKLAESVPVTQSADRPPEPSDFTSTQSQADPEILYQRPSLTDQHDSAAPVSAIAALKACARRYFLSTIAPQHATVFLSSGAIETGLAVHRILAGETLDHPEAQMLADRFRQSDLSQRSQRASRIEREFDFMFHSNDIVVRGRMDLWFEEDGELILVDYKTDRDEASAAQYATQLRLYAVALAKYAGRVPDRAYLYYLRSDRVKEISLEEGELAKALDSIAAFRDAQDRLEFPLTVAGHCRTCDYFQNLCPAQLV
jgi:ATP-dependent exoDNAse (exonuclease V) beta subunit